VTVDPTLIAYHTKFWGDDPMWVDNPALDDAPAAIVEIWRRGTFTSDWTPEDYERARAAWPTLLALTRKLHDAGVRLTAGSDLPNPWIVPSTGLHEELVLLASAGIDPLEVIGIATHDAAVALGIDDEFGTIEAGMRADLLVLTADPTSDLRHTRAIRWVVQDGRMMTPASILPPAVEPAGREKTTR